MDNAFEPGHWAYYISLTQDKASLIDGFFDALTASSPDSRRTWLEFLHRFQARYDELSDAMGRSLEHGELIHLLTLLLIPVARHGVLHPDRTVPMFHAAERIGVHTLPVHFHSPIPNTAELDESVWSRRFDRPEAWSLNAPQQLGLLASIGRFAPELAAIPDRAEAALLLE